ncbi:MAG: hypothetical protein QG635_39, partial [Bacteroidota bacterium]|nr:hypothetical protein [Bacteroidota bacterium]
MPDKEKTNIDELFSQIKDLIQSSRNTVLRTIDTTMVITYFQIGYLIVEHEQKGKLRAEYSKNTLAKLSKKLNIEFGKGFSVPNLE